MTDFTSDTPPAGMTEPFTVTGVAAMFGADPKTVARWDNQAPVSFRTPGGHRRFSWAAVRQLAARPAPPPAAHRGAPGPHAAVLAIGAGVTAGLHLTPVPADAAPPGHAALILGWTSRGKPVTLATASLPWLDDLEAAIQAARAQAVVAAELAATP